MKVGTQNVALSLNSITEISGQVVDVVERMNKSTADIEDNAQSVNSRKRLSVLNYNTIDMHMI